MSGEFRLCLEYEAVRCRALAACSEVWVLDAVQN